MKAITIDARVSGYAESPIGIVGVCLPKTGQILLKKINRFEHKVVYNENTIVVTDTPQMVDNWQLAFIEKEHLDEVIRTYQMRAKNGLIRLEKELERFNPSTVIAVRKIDKNGTVQELNSDSLSNGHIAVLLAVWASAKASVAHSCMKAPNEEKTESNLLTPFTITTVSAPKQKMRWLF